MVTAGGDQLIHQDSPSIAGVVEPHDYYGDRLETGDYNCDGYDDVVVGVPRENLSSGGLSQSTSGIPGTLEASDYMGQDFWTEDFDGDGYGDLATLVPGDGCGAGTKGFLIARRPSTGEGAVESPELHADPAAKLDDAIATYEPGQ